MFKHGFPPEWSTFKKLIWLVGSGIAGASYIWKTVTGTLIHITDALASPMQKCEVSLEPIQDLHGQDAPYPAGGGINAMPNDVASDSTSFGVRCVTNGNGIYTLSGTADGGTATFNISLSESFVIPTSATHKVLFKNSSNNNKVDFVFMNGTTQVDSWGMTPANRTHDSYQVMGGKTCDGIKITVTDGASVSMTISPMFVLQSESNDVAYAPYSNICPITGWTGCKVTRDDVNLFDADNLESFSTGSNNSVYGHKYTKAGTYSLHCYQKGTGTAYIYAKIKNADGTWGNVLYLVGGGNPTENLIATISEGQTLHVYNANASTESASISLFEEWKVQVAYSSTQPDEYHAYQGNTYSVTFPDGQAVYGGTVDLVSGVLTATHKLTTILNTFDMAISGTPTATITVAQINGSSFGGIKSGTQPISNRFSNSIPSGNIGRMVYGAPNLFLVVPTSELSAASVAGLKEWFGNNETQICSELATPIEIQLTPQEISTLKGVNNVWSNANGDTTIIYKAQSS